MLLFAFGLVCGVVLLFLFFLWFAERESLGWSVLRARQDLADIERQTIQHLFATELAARRTGGSTPRAAGTDIIDGTATDMGRPQ